jgi:hypothetical protein
MKKLVLLLALSFMLTLAADARQPKIGDFVEILAGTGITYCSYAGNLTYVSDGLICMNCTRWKDSDGLSYDLKDVCIGTGQIIRLSWPETRMIPLYMNGLN